MNRILDSDVHRHIRKRNMSEALVWVCICWGLTLIAFVLDQFGWGFGRLGTVVPPFFWVIFSLVVTVLGGLHAAWWYWKATLLARWGIQVKGTVRHIGGTTDYRPFRRLKFSFMYNNRAYMVVMWGGLGAYSVGSSVQVIIDPDKPKRCMFREDVFPPGYDLDGN